MPVVAPTTPKNVPTAPVIAFTVPVITPTAFISGIDSDISVDRLQYFETSAANGQNVNKAVECLLDKVSTTLIIARAI